MEVIRTFHPVGQGAFYTEKFTNDDQEEFTVVYDCGSETGKAEKLETGINSALSTTKNKNIDILFISHFHNDHVNGITYLKEHYNITQTHPLFS